MGGDELQALLHEDDGFRTQHRLTYQGQPVSTQRTPGLHHVRDDIGHSEPDSRLHRAVQFDNAGVDATVSQVGRDQPGE